MLLTAGKMLIPRFSISTYLDDTVAESKQNSI